MYVAIAPPHQSIIPCGFLYTYFYLANKKVKCLGWSTGLKRKKSKCTRLRKAKQNDKIQKQTAQKLKL